MTITSQGMTRKVGSDEQLAMFLVEDVQLYFLDRVGLDGYIPRAEWILHWLLQRKTPAQIYAIAMNQEHLEAQ